METLAPMPDLVRDDDEPIELLLADDDPVMRSLLASSARAAIDSLAVHEAADGAEAIQIGLQRRPQIALLDARMPRLGGVEVALVLRELVPGLRLALHTGDPAAHCHSARELCLPLFDKQEFDRVLRWLEFQARRRRAA